MSLIQLFSLCKKDTFVVINWLALVCSQETTRGQVGSRDRCVRYIGVAVLCLVCNRV